MNLEDNQTLKTLNIEVLPATKFVARPFMIDGLYFGAEVYEFRDIFLVYVCSLHCYTEQDLKNELKSLKCEYLMQRTFENFKKWYESFSKKLTKKQIKEISKKF